MLNPLEMDGGSVEAEAASLRRAPYAQQFVQLFGPTIFDTPRRYASPRRCSRSPATRSRTRASTPTPANTMPGWKEKARLSQAELRGYLLFNDPEKADCAGCHLDQPTPDGLPPLFTDDQYEALGVPRNTALARQPRSELLRSRHLRPDPHRHEPSSRSIAACS